MEPEHSRYITLLVYVEPDVVVNPHYDHAKHSKNWVAIRSGRNSVVAERVFLRSYFQQFDTLAIRVGDVLEFAQNIPKSGYVERVRFYYVVLNKGCSGIQVEMFGSLAKALESQRGNFPEHNKEPS